MTQASNAAERAEVKGVLAGASTRDNVHSFAKLTAVVDGERRFIDKPPTLERLADGPVRDRVIAILERYPASLADDRQVLLGRYRLVDVARKTVGIGSVGLAAWVGLYLGRDDDDPLVLQVKEAVASVLTPYTASTSITDEGRRVVAGQRLMQAASDTFLGWASAPDGGWFYVRQLADMKWSPDLTTITRDELTVFARLCGQALARAHARSGDRGAIAGYLGSSDEFDRAVASFATAYAAQNAADHAAFVAAIADGRLVSGDSG
jgi:uncharacterized protein (DUF2252 family)